MLQEPLEQLLQKCKPDCLVADMFFPWAIDAANKFGMPRLVFHGTSFFSLSASECMRLYEAIQVVRAKGGVLGLQIAEKVRLWGYGKCLSFRIKWNQNQSKTQET